MAIHYDYNCGDCGPMVLQQSIRDAALQQCPRCGGKAFQRLISRGQPEPHLIAGAAGGWSSTGYALPENARRVESVLGRKLTRPAR